MCQTIYQYFPLCGIPSKRWLLRVQSFSIRLKRADFKPIFHWKYESDFVSLNTKDTQELNDMEINELLISFVVLYLMLSAVALVPPAITKTRYWITWWDYVYPLLTMPFWFALWKLHIGDDVSTTNFAFEVFFLLILSVATPWIRYYLAYSQKKMVVYLSNALTFLPIITTLIMRLSVPHLPT
jgi:hypothetical protein